MAGGGVVVFLLHSRLVLVSAFVVAFVRGLSDTQFDGNTVRPIPSRPSVCFVRASSSALRKLFRFCIPSHPPPQPKTTGLHGDQALGHGHLGRLQGRYGQGGASMLSTDARVV